MFSIISLNGRHSLQTKFDVDAIYAERSNDLLSKLRITGDIPSLNLVISQQMV